MQLEIEHLRMGATRAEEEEREFDDLRSEINRLRGETSSLCVEYDGARGDVDRLQDEASQLGEALHGVKSRAELTESSSQEAEARMVQVYSEHVRERNATGGQLPFLPLMYLSSVIPDYLTLFFHRALQDALSSAGREGHDR